MFGASLLLSVHICLYLYIYLCVTTYMHIYILRKGCV